MNVLEAVCLEPVEGDIQALGICLDALEKHSLSQVPWAAYPYRPEVSFCIAHQRNRILLRYYVNEKSIRAQADQLNGRVWEDSCVEFFIAFDGEGYYNFEFNCIGTALGAYGQNRNNRGFIAEAVLKQIQFQSMITSNEDGTVHWELTLVLPVTIFVHHSIQSLSERLCRVNFYKCGDLLPEPHFLSWMPLFSREPDFHQPGAFGSMIFK